MLRVCESPDWKLDLYRCLGAPVVPFYPFSVWVPLLYPNSRKKGTLSIKGLLGNLDAARPSPRTTASKATSGSACRRFRREYAAMRDRGMLSYNLTGSPGAMISSLLSTPGGCCPDLYHAKAH